MIDDTGGIVSRSDQEGGHTIKKIGHFHISNEILRRSNQAIWSQPTLAVPYLSCVIIQCSILFYVTYRFDSQSSTVGQMVLLAIGIVFGLTLLLSFVCCLLLEAIQQHESTGKMSLSKAMSDTITRNLLALIPIALLWSVLWFFLALINALLHPSRKYRSADPSLESAARLIGGADKDVLDYSFSLLQKGVRMVTFLVLPAIAWENRSTTQALKRGMQVFRARLGEFTLGFFFNEGLILLLTFPVALLFYFASKGFVIPPPLWIACIIYLVVIWSYSIYLEQMYTAQLFLWNKAYEKKCAEHEAQSLPAPRFDEIPLPLIFDGKDSISAFSEETH